MAESYDSSAQAEPPGPYFSAVESIFGLDRALPDPLLEVTPPAAPFVPTEDVHFAASWTYLHDVLAALKRPPVLDRRGCRPVPGREVLPPNPGDCIVFLSHPEGRWGITVAAGRVLPPGAFVWAICPTWLSRDGDRLLVHRGIWADASGRLYLDDFSPPRVATYYANLMSGPDTYGQRDDGDALEPGLGCPMSSSTELSWSLGCKVTTRALAAAAGARVPRSIALFPEGRPAHLMDLEARTQGLVEGVSLEEPLGRLGRGPEALEALTAWLLEVLTPRLAAWPADIIGLVVKPSGPYHMLARGVSLHPRDGVGAVARAAATLLVGAGVVPIRPGDSILVDAFGGGVQRTMRVRAVVARIGDDPVRAKVQALMAGIGPSFAPISGVTAFPQHLQPALEAWGVADASVAAEALAADLTRQAEATLRAVAAADVPVPGKPGAQTDLIGLDLVMALPGDTAPGQEALKPVLIEVNNHDCTDLTQIFGYTQTDHRHAALGAPNGGLLDEYLRALADRSARHQVRGKTVLVVGGVTESKRCAWEAARRAGVRLVLADDRVPDASAGPGGEVVATLVVPGMNDDHSPEGDEAHASAITAALAARGIDVDGVVTFCEDCAVLAARVAERLGKRTHGVAAQRRAKDKRSTLAALMAPVADMMDGHQPNPATLAPRSVLLETAGDVWGEAAARVPFPAVLKRLYGSSAVGTRVVRDRAEAAAEAVRLFELGRQGDEANSLYRLCGFSFKGEDGLLLSEYADGSEHDVDLILFEGQLVDAVVTDNAPTLEPLCAETISIMPSLLSEARQRQLITAALQTCEVLGLTDGVFNVELKASRTGPKVIDVNGRMGGFYIPYWVKSLWSLDLPLAAFQIACGIRPVGRVARAAQGYVAGVQVYPGDGHDRCHLGGREVLHVPYTRDEASAEITEYPEPVGNVAVSGATPAEALSHLRGALAELYRDAPERGAVLTRLLDVFG